MKRRSFLTAISVAPAISLLAKERNDDIIKVGDKVRYVTTNKSGKIHYVSDQSTYEVLHIHEYKDNKQGNCIFFLSNGQSTMISKQWTRDILINKRQECWYHLPKEIKKKALAGSSSRSKNISCSK